MPIDYMLKSQWKQIKVKDKTHRVLSNGVRIPTDLNMMRQAKKIGR